MSCWVLQQIICSPSCSQNFQNLRFLSGKASIFRYQRWSGRYISQNSNYFCEIDISTMELPAMNTCCKFLLLFSWCRTIRFPFWDFNRTVYSSSTSRNTKFQCLSTATIVPRAHPRTPLLCLVVTCTRVLFAYNLLNAKDGPPFSLLAISSIGFSFLYKGKHKCLCGDAPCVDIQPWNAVPIFLNPPSKWETMDGGNHEWFQYQHISNFYFFLLTLNPLSLSLTSDMKFCLNREAAIESKEL